jgi:class 3 adenylate cyclase
MDTLEPPPASLAPALDDPSPATMRPMGGAAPLRRRWFTTVMFIDIVDSTRRVARLGDARWLDVAEAYEAEVRRRVRRFRGRVLVVAGDGMVAAFASPMAGVRCAVEIHRATRRLGLDVRAGLHAGECERRGRRIGGLVFHIGARLAHLAEAGEVLVSDAVKDHAGEAGLTYTARGVRRLRGVPGRWPLYAAEPSASFAGRMAVG